MRARIALVVLITAALLAAAWWQGILSLLWSADHVHAVPVISGLVLLGLGCGWMGRWNAVDWLAEKLPILGLIGTGYGAVLVALSHSAQDMSSDAGRWAIGVQLICALISNVFAAAALGWLQTLDYICRPSGGAQ